MIAPPIRLALGAALAALAASAPCRAADLEYAPPEAPVREAAPFYVVKEGPVHSGPGIVITATPVCDTDLKRTYPYIRSTRAAYWPLRYSGRPRYDGRAILRVRAQALPERATDAFAKARTDVTGSLKRAARDPREFHGRADVRLVGKNRIDIKIYRSARDLDPPAPVTRKHKKHKRRHLVARTRSRPLYVAPYGGYIERERGRIGDVQTLDLPR